MNAATDLRRCVALWGRCGGRPSVVPRLGCLLPGLASLLEAAAALAAGAEPSVGAPELDGGELEALSCQRVRELAGASLEGACGLALDAQVEGAVAHPQVQLERPGRASVELEVGRVAEDPALQLLARLRGGVEGYGLRSGCSG